jgi:uncharacterized protein
MRYRRFGRTELQMPVFSCGGMRYQHRWQDLDPSEIPADNQANLEATIHRALEVGINHIETARGYGSSEMQLGWVLPSLPREELIVQTKIAPTESPLEFAEKFETSMRYLRLDHVDLLSFHGINTDELLDWTVGPGGCLEVARRLQREGRVRFIGFSTHAPCRVIVSAMDTGEFDYVNLHWYFVNPPNWPAVEAAARMEMGVFIISPSDKGGRLQEPSAKMQGLCHPLTPMQFNDLYCLSRPEVHTLSLGAARPSDFDEHVAALDHYDRAEETSAPIAERIRLEMERVVGREWVEGWWKGLPEHNEIPGGINVLEILRLWTYAKSLDLSPWGKMRYNLMGSGSHWAAGNHASDFDEAALRAALVASPVRDRIPEVLRDAHAMFYSAPEKRLSES